MACAAPPPVVVPVETKVEELSCEQGSSWSWPTVIIIMVGGFVIIYGAVTPGIGSNQRVLTIITMLLWTALWAIILQRLWDTDQRARAWWLLIIPLVTMIMFFTIILLLNLQVSAAA